MILSHRTPLGTITAGSCEGCDVAWSWHYGYTENYDDTGKCIPVRWLEGIDCEGNVLLKQPVQYYPCDVDPSIECVCQSIGSAFAGIGQTYDVDISGNTIVIDTSNAFVTNALNLFVSNINSGGISYLRFAIGVDVLFYSGRGSATISNIGTVYTITVTNENDNDGCDDERDNIFGSSPYITTDGTLNAVSNGAFGGGRIQYTCTNPTTPEASITPLNPQPLDGTVFCGECPIVDDCECLTAEAIAEAISELVVPFDTIVYCDDSGTKRIVTIDKDLNVISNQTLLSIIPDYEDCPCDEGGA